MLRALRRRNRAPRQRATTSTSARASRRTDARRRARSRDFPRTPLAGDRTDRVAIGIVTARRL
jgi:hypothetical protein